jgi:hypothetical protein
VEFCLKVLPDFSVLGRLAFNMTAKMFDIGAQALCGAASIKPSNGDQTSSKMKEQTQWQTEGFKT